MIDIQKARCWATRFSRSLAMPLFMMIALMMGSCVAAKAQIASGFERFANMASWADTDFSKVEIDAVEILSGGPPKDGIPAIDQPQFVTASDIQDLDPQEPVITFSHQGDVKAYPLRILIWHEIVNDVVGGKPVTVTYCPLCNSSIVFDRSFEGKILDFGTTGLLRNSDLVMYDRQSQTWWQQFTGQGLVGTHAGKSLKMLPSRIDSFEVFRTDHPNGKVLVPNDPDIRSYGRNPYVGYDMASVPFLYRGDLPEGIAPMERVIYVRDDADASAHFAISLNLLAVERELHRANYRLRWAGGLKSALDAATIANGRDVGQIRVEKKSSDGIWSDVVHDITFAFVVHAFYPSLTIEKAPM